MLLAVRIQMYQEIISLLFWRSQPTRKVRPQQIIDTLTGSYARTEGLDSNRETVPSDPDLLDVAEYNPV